MNIYLVWKGGIVICVTTLPRVALNEFKLDSDKVQVWRNDKVLKIFSTVNDFIRFINPPRTEDDEEIAANNNEW